MRNDLPMIGLVYFFFFFALTMQTKSLDMSMFFLLYFRRAKPAGMRAATLLQSGLGEGGVITSTVFLVFSHSFSMFSRQSSYNKYSTYTTIVRTDRRLGYL